MALVWRETGGRMFCLRREGWGGGRSWVLGLGSLGSGLRAQGSGLRAQVASVAHRPARPRARPSVPTAGPAYTPEFFSIAAGGPPTARVPSDDQQLLQTERYGPGARTCSNGWRRRASGGEVPNKHALTLCRAVVYAVVSSSPDVPLRLLDMPLALALRYLYIQPSCPTISTQHRSWQSSVSASERAGFPAR